MSNSLSIDIKLILSYLLEKSLLGVIIFLTLIFIKWITYIRLTPLEKKLRTNIEKIFEKIINVCMTLVIIFILFLQKFYRTILIDNPKYTIKELFEAIPLLFPYTIPFIIGGIAWLIVFEILGKFNFFYDSYVTDYGKRYYLVGRFDKKYISFKYEYEEDGEKKFVDVLKQNEFILNRPFITPTFKISMKPIKQLIKAANEVHRDPKYGKIRWVFFFIDLLFLAYTIFTILFILELIWTIYIFII